MPADHPRVRHRTAGHHAGRLQRRAADRTPRRRQRRHHRRRGPEKDPAGIRCLPRRAGKGRKGQRQCQGRAQELGRRRMVHQPPRAAQEPDHHRVQGHRRNQHRRPLPGPRRLEPPGHSAARAGDAEKSAPRHRAAGAGQDRPDQVHRDPEGQGPPHRLRRRRGRHRLLAQVRHQLRAVAHRRRHSLRAEQALRRRLPGQQDRADFLQHHGRRRRPADRARRFADEHGRRGRVATLRRRGAEGWQGNRQVRNPLPGAVRRSARRRPHSA